MHIQYIYNLKIVRKELKNTYFPNTLAIINVNEFQFCTY